MQNRHIKLLDVTLRDGGYKTNFSYSPEAIQTIITLLDQANIPYIEIGYRNGPLKVTPNLGETGTCPRNYIEYCRRLMHKAKLTVILHPKNLNSNDLIEMKDSGVDAIRICFPIGDANLGFKTIEHAVALGFEVFANLTRVTQYQVSELVSWSKKLVEYPLQALYLADSNGNLKPAEIKNIFTAIAREINIPLGFHAHDNLFLAQANSCAAIESGVEYIDASLHGFGKGLGNLRTEGIVSYLQSMGNKQHDLIKLLHGANFIKQNYLSDKNDPIEKDIILGIFNLSQDDANLLGKFDNTQDYYYRAENLYRTEKNACNHYQKKY